MSDETDLEDEFRAGLQRRADDVDTTVDLLGPAHGGRTRSPPAGPGSPAPSASQRPRW